MDSYCTSKILYEPYECIISQFYKTVLPVMESINNNNNIYKFVVLKWENLYLVENVLFI